MADPSSSNDSDREPIKITDKRHFDADGSPKETVPEPGEETPGSADETVRGPDFTFHHAESPDSRRDASPGREGGLPSADFSTLVASFGTSALVHLGLVEDPTTGKGEVNLEGARQMIDFLTLLQEKTAGNLTPQEKRLLDQVLSEVQLHYVKKTSEGPSAP